MTVTERLEGHVVGAPLIIGNWKMNGTAVDLAVIDEIERGLGDVAAVDVAVCPPATLLMAAAERSHRLRIGGQDCHFLDRGAHTGDISAPMLRSAGATLVIVGHSERRSGFGEGSGDVARKAEAAQAAGLVVVLCVGETGPARSAGLAVETVVDQLASSLPPYISSDHLVIAYEPIWAIGSGRTPNDDEIAEMHGALRRHMSSSVEHGESVRILYGGSVTPSSAERLMRIANVDGVLVGGASLRADDLLAIVEAGRRAASAM